MVKLKAMVENKKTNDETRIIKDSKTNEEFNLE
jgi:hypothetical protein